MFSRYSTTYSNASCVQTLCTTVRIEMKSNRNDDHRVDFSIRGLVKAKALNEQVASMDKIVGQMKTNKEQVYKPVQQLKQRIDQLIKEITVRLSVDHFHRRMNFCLFRIHRSLQHRLIRRPTILLHRLNENFVD